MRQKIGTEAVRSPVGQNFTALEIFEVFGATEVICGTELVMFMWIGTAGSPKRGGHVALGVAEMVKLGGSSRELQRSSDEVVWKFIRQNFPAAGGLFWSSLPGVFYEWRIYQGSHLIPAVVGLVNR